MFTIHSFDTSIHTHIFPYQTGTIAESIPPIYLPLQLLFLNAQQDFLPKAVLGEVDTFKMQLDPLIAAWEQELSGILPSEQWCQHAPNATADFTRLVS